MTCSEFLSSIKSRGANIAPMAAPNKISMANALLQQNNCAMLPEFMQQLYSQTGGINLGSGYIFGPDDTSYSSRHSAPSIAKINQDTPIHGKTIFGRNDLFWFAFDIFGTCYMLDNLTLKPLRKYDDPFKALTDCLIAGMI